MNDELVLRIRPDGSVLMEEVTDGTVSLKNIGADDLLKGFRDSVARSGITVHSGLLPKNCIAFRCNCETGNRFVALDFDTGKADVTYRSTCYESFPLPRLVFGFYADKSGRVDRVKLGVTADEKLTEKTGMFIYPFSNVSGFSLCTGGNALPSVQSLSQLSNLPWHILALPNNNDNFNERNNALGLGHRELLEHLKTKPPAYYYERILIPMNKTLKDFINN